MKKPKSKAAPVEEPEEMAEGENPAEEAGETPEAEGLEEEAEGEGGEDASEKKELVSGEENTNTIEGLLKMSDQELMEVLGMTRQLTQVREDLMEMSKLKGEARNMAEEKVERLLTPQVSESSFRYALEDIEREFKQKDAKGAYGDASPASVL